MIISLIVAMNRQGVIGWQGRLPWHVPTDLQYFKAKTLGKPIIMGRKTYTSIGKALPNRHNIVLSKDANFHPTDASVAHDLTAALQLVDPTTPEVMIIGGAQIFALALPLAQKFYLTLLDIDTPGDTYLPAWQTPEWHCIETTPFYDEKSQVHGEFQTWVRNFHK